MSFPECPSPPGNGEPRPKAAGRFLFVGDHKLEVRGATYGTFRPDRLGVPYPDPQSVRRDFGSMAQWGFNAVRVYTVPPRWLLDAALEAGLRVMVGVPWEQHVAYLDDPHIRRHVTARVRRGVTACRDHPAVLCYAIGNEIPSNIVRWHGRRRVEEHLRGLTEVARDADPEGMVTYVNYPSTEYLDLPFLDLVSFNVFLESAEELSSYVARLQNVAGDRPLLLTELGLDSRRHGPEAQALLLERQVYAAREGGSSGSFVFSWTDEWHRGGWEVEDWDFGLTTRDRQPKPALASVHRALSRRLAPSRGWPRITVVVCVYNGARWIGDCLEGCQRIDYPNYEVVVVDNGSSDETPEIASRYDVRLLRTSPTGLSAARNVGLEAADGDIVAYVDADARPDPDWLTHLALAFDTDEFVGIGGPNIAPPEDGGFASCVANAPGGPVHVLVGDREADHIPGCNMAFRREGLAAIGGFDPLFRVAGDDVDVCWRLQKRGWKLGFAPAAVVWHHPRESLSQFWRQQRGYGAAEALLETKWPEKYNAAGHVTWRGRVYGPPTVTMPGRRSRVYGGTWGEAGYQHLEAAAPTPLWDLAMMPEWYLALAVLTCLSVVGLLWSPLLLALPALAAGIGLTVVRAFRGAERARFHDGPLEPAEWERRFRTVILLHLVQPAARLWGRLTTGLVPWRGRAHARRFVWPPVRRLESWREHGEPVRRTLSRIERSLRRDRCAVRRGGGYDRWDLQVDGGSLGFARLRSCAEDHGHGRQFLRVEIRPHFTAWAWACVVAGPMLTTWASLDGALLVAALLGATTVAVALRAAWESGSSAAALAEASTEAEATLAAEGAPQHQASPKTAAQPVRTQSLILR
jgi:GT2 family glycosyltransferase